MKPCSKCKEIKPLDCFYKDKTKKFGRTAYCISCQIIKYNQNKETFLEANKKWRQENKEKYLAKKRVSSTQWQKNNKDKVRSISQAYQASKLKSIPKWLSEEQKQQILTEYSLAVWCSEVMKTPYHVDHIVPLRGENVCGLHVPWNLQVIPASVNIAKSNKWKD